MRQGQLGSCNMWIMNGELGLSVVARVVRWVWHLQFARKSDTAGHCRKGRHYGLCMTPNSGIEVAIWCHYDEQGSIR